MKKWLCMLLTLGLLLQALPLSALAAAGHVLTAEELAAAYALTGFADSGVQRNAVFHKGMTPNESWNAMQVSDWLDEQLNTYMYSVEEILSRASVKLAQLKENDREGYSRFSDDNPKYEGMVDYIRGVYGSAETLREELRFQQDRLEEQAGLIAELGRKLKEQGDSLYASEKVRLSARIEAAEAELKAARAEVAKNAEHWEENIHHLQMVLDPSFDGAAEPDFPGANVGEWLSELSAYGTEAAENSVPVTRVNKSGSRLGRMSSNDSVFKNADNATVHVMSENEIGLKFYTLDENGQKKALQGMKVTVQDVRNKDAVARTYTTRADGTIFPPANIFTEDDDKNVLFKLDVEGEEQGVRSYGSAKVEMKLGEVRQIPMAPLSGAVGNGVASNANGPYIYSASFEGNDILGDSWEMIYSHLNNWDFEIKVEVRNPGGGNAPEPLMSYYAEGDSASSYEQRWASPTSHEGNVYTFKGKWKKTLAPDVNKELYPCFAFSKSESAERFETELKSIKSVVDSPFEAGSDAFMGVYEQGLGFAFQVPLGDDHTLDIAFNLPWKKYLPKINIDNAGFITAFIGTDLFSEKLEDKASWQSRDMKDFQQGQKRAERESGFAQAKAQLSAAYDYYKTGGWKFLGESKLEFGWFLLFSGRADGGKEEGEVGVMEVRGGTGVLLKYSYSWTIVHMLGPVPLYVSFTLGVNAGVGLSMQVGWSWKDGESGFGDFEFKPLKDITILISFSFMAQAGAGVKGMVDLYFRFMATMNFRITLVLMGAGLNSFTVGGEIGITIGLTALFIEVSKTFGPWGGIWYDSTASNALPPLQQYYAKNAAEPEQVVAASQEPTSYPGLAPAAKALLTDQKNAHSAFRVATSNGHAFVFYLERAENASNGEWHNRVCWLDANNNRRGTAADFDIFGRGVSVSDGDDYTFDVWSDGKTIFLVAANAIKFDEDSYPTASGGGDNSNHCIYLLPLSYSYDRDRLVHASGVAEYPVVIPTDRMDEVSSPRGVTNPHIDWADVTYTSGGAVSSVQLYGFAEGVGVGNGEDVMGYTGFRYAGGNDFTLTSDSAVQNALGSDHERVNMVALAEGMDSTQVDPNGACYGFISLSRPRDGAEGESAIEYYDWRMNGTALDKRRPIVLKKGDIGSFEVIQKVTSTYNSQALFYTDAETNGDGVKAYRLKSLTVDRARGYNTFNIYEDTYDVTIPTPEFKVYYSGDQTLIYWLTAVGKKEKQTDPDTWQVWVSILDMHTNTASTPSVYSEFTLESGYVLRNLELTSAGHSFLTATPLPKDGDKQPQPMTLFSIPLSLTPVLTMKGMSVEDTVVAAGDFEDSTIVVMNEGNIGLSGFDVEMFTREGGKVNVVETLHCDCLNPDKSYLAVGSGNNTKKLLEGRQAIYRNSDYDFSSRQREWVTTQTIRELSIDIHARTGYWVENWSGERSTSLHTASTMLMPGALASFTGALKIPENWSGDKTLYLRISATHGYANWQGALANAAGVKSNSGARPNAAATTELTWALNEAGDKLVLQTEGLASNAAFMNAVKSGLIANAVDVGEDVPLNVAVHDIEVDHREYRDVDGTELLDIVISNFADTKDTFKLSCEVFLDGSDESYVVTLPFYSQAVSSRTTHTITLPLETLVPDAGKHSRARVVVTAVGREEAAMANNEFLIFLGGGSELRFAKQPEDQTVQEGEDVTFSVEVEGGKKPYTYQWQVWDPKHEKWVDLPGFTEPTLSREKIEKKWDGARFRCVVTDAEGTQIVSREVTLTVRDRVDTGDHSNLTLYLIVAFAALTLLAVLRKRLGRRAS